MHSRALSPKSAYTCALTLLFISGELPAQSLSNGCLPFSEQTRASLLSYVRQALKVPATEPLDLAASSLNERTCYRRLQFVSSDLSSRVTLFLSPDQRFLSQTVFDTALAPAEGSPLGGGKGVR